MPCLSRREAGDRGQPTSRGGKPSSKSIGITAKPILPRPRSNIHPCPCVVARYRPFRDSISRTILSGSDNICVSRPAERTLWWYQRHYSARTSGSSARPCGLPHNFDLYRCDFRMLAQTIASGSMSAAHHQGRWLVPVAYCPKPISIKRTRHAQNLCKSLSPLVLRIAKPATDLLR